MTATPQAAVIMRAHSPRPGDQARVPDALRRQTLSVGALDRVAADTRSGEPVARRLARIDAIAIRLHAGTAIRPTAMRCREESEGRHA
jgi:hypothetical protein